MAQKRLKSMIFPGLSDTYTVPQALSDLTDYSDFTDAQQDIVDLQTGLTAAEESVTTYVVGNTNTTGVQLDPGTYVWVKNHSVLTDGLYTVGSTAIVQGGSVVDTNMNAVSEGGLNDLKNTIPTTNWATLSTGIEYRKINGLVQVYINLAVSLSASDTTLGTMPSGFRPSKPVYIRASGSGGTGNVTVTVGTNGAIKAWTDSGTNSAVNAFIVY